MSDDIYRIIERLAILEGRITPTSVKHGLNAQQQGVRQLPALFRPQNISPTLSKKPYQKHPMDGYLVGEGRTCAVCDCDPCECEPEEKIAEARADEEKLLDKVKKSFIDYLDSVEDRVKKDSDLKDKTKDDGDLKKKDTKDRDLIAKISQALDEDPTGEEPANTDLAPGGPVENPTYSEPTPAAIKTMTMEDGRTCEIHGDERQGFEIRHGGRALKSRFKNMEQAQMAFEMYCARARERAQSADYLDER